MNREATPTRSTRVGLATAAAGIVVAALLTAACAGPSRSETTGTVAPTTAPSTTAADPATTVSPTTADTTPADETLSGPAGRLTALSSAPAPAAAEPSAAEPVELASVAPATDPAPAAVALHVVAPETWSRTPRVAHRGA